MTQDESDGPFHPETWKHFDPQGTKMNFYPETK